jgi:V/A-type H+-transporting ATPase subunit K
MKGKKLFIFVILIVLGMALFAEGDSESAAPAKSVWQYFAAALAVGISCIAGGLAVSKIGSAAMGAMSENAELSGKALPYAGLAEGICLWGFLVALLILVIN